MYQLFQKFEASHPFTETEAWLLFRIAAIGEACGWSLLITGILVSKYITPHDTTALIFAGRTHGMLFLAYILAALGLYPSLGWSRWQGLFAAAFSVPPYGTLIFERWASTKRHNSGFKTYHHFLLYNVIMVGAPYTQVASNDATCV